MMGTAARCSMPHPALFTKGSKWRFHSRRHIHDTGQRIEVGEEFEVVAPYYNTTKVLAIRSETIDEFRSPGHVKFYSKNPQVTGTLNYNEIYRFVEQVATGEDMLYYLREDDRRFRGRYYTGKDSDPDHHDFSMAQYWENPIRAQKRALQLNNVGKNSAYHQRWRVWRYDNVNDVHTDVSLPDHAHGILKWLSKFVSGRVQRSEVEKVAADLIVRNPTIEKLILVKMPSWQQGESLIHWCGGARIKRPTVIHQYAFFDTLDDAMMVKMGWGAKGIVEVFEVGPGTEKF
jgi:hypothetical protein